MWFGVRCLAEEGGGSVPCESSGQCRWPVMWHTWVGSPWTTPLHCRVLRVGSGVWVPFQGVLGLDEQQNATTNAKIKRERGKNKTQISM